MKKNPTEAEKDTKTGQKGGIGREKKKKGIKGWLVAHVMEETWSLASLAGSL